MDSNNLKLIAQLVCMYVYYIASFILSSFLLIGVQVLPKVDNSRSVQLIVYIELLEYYDSHSTGPLTKTVGNIYATSRGCPVQSSPTIVICVIYNGHIFLPCTMAIISLQELSIYYHLDASTIIDLWQYLDPAPISQSKRAK